MGRKARFTDVDHPKKGPGRKSKKQKDPTFSDHLKNTHHGVNSNGMTEDRKLSHRQKQRLARRAQKKQEWKEKRKAIKEKKIAAKNQPKEPEIKIQGRMVNIKKKKETILSKSSAKIKNELLESYSGTKSKWIKPKVDDMKNKKKKRNHEEMYNEDFEKNSDNDTCAVGTLDDIDDSGEENVNDDYANGHESYDEEDDESRENESNIEESESEKSEDGSGEKNIDDENEMQLNVSSKDIFAFPSDDQINETIPIPEVEQRIRDILFVLSDFKKFREEDRPREEYISLLKKDLCTYFSYNEFLMERVMHIFPLDELMNFLEASEAQRPVTIRTNSLKVRRRDLAQALIGRGVNVDPIGKWTTVGLVVYDSPVPIGATPEYLAGLYMIQAASSLLPVIALAPREEERILDMCSAPGGKGSHIAALMKNTGVLFANDVNKTRVNGIVGNFHRLGITNAIVSSYDGRQFPQVMKGFDRILVDAPCTGTGVISKDPSVKTNKDETDVQRCFTLQRELLLAAIDCLNSRSSSGGYLVYSTCSILPEENEAVVNFALRKRDVKLVPTGLDFGTEGFVKYRQYRFHPTMNLTRRFYPHTHNMDGFFVAKLKKFSDVIPKSKTTDNEDDS